MQRVIAWMLASISLVACQSPSSRLEALASDFTWTQAADCPQPRFEAMGLAVNGQLLVMGGFVSGSLAVTSRVDVFDPDANVWSQRQDLPGAETHAAAVLKDGTVYVAAGFRGPFQTWVTSSEFWAYDFANDVWNGLPSLPARRAALSLTNVGDTFFRHRRSCSGRQLGLAR